MNMFIQLLMSEMTPLHYSHESVAVYTNVLVI